ncbi:MAG TPA: hypothetical protein VM307_14705, partial [Egibacteraceae bacterium]|nr:hypothetical protein [Egibacteraceae bacterium]
MSRRGQWTAAALTVMTAALLLAAALPAAGADVDEISAELASTGVYVAPGATADEASVQSAVRQ